MNDPKQVCEDCGEPVAQCRAARLLAKADHIFTAVITAARSVRNG